MLLNLPQGIVQRANSRSSLFLCSGRIDHEIGVFDLFFEGHLPVHSVLHLRARGVVASHGSFDLQLGAANRQDQPVKIPVTSRFY